MTYGKCTSQWFSVNFIQLYSCHHNPILIHIHYPQKVSGSCLWTGAIHIHSTPGNGSYSCISLYLSLGDTWLVKVQEEVEKGTWFGLLFRQLWPKKKKKKSVKMAEAKSHRNRTRTLEVGKRNWGQWIERQVARAIEGSEKTCWNLFI